MSEDKKHIQTPEDEVEAVMESVLMAANAPARASILDVPVEAEPEEPDDAIAASDAGDECAEQGEPDAPEAQEDVAPTDGREGWPTLEEDLTALDTLERHIFAHRYAAAEISAFGETIDPPDVTEDRGEVLATLAEEDHERLATPEVAALVNRLQARAQELDVVRAAQVRVLARDRHMIVSCSARDHARLARLETASYEAWVKAKATNDWRSFAPFLDRMVNLKRRMALAANPDKDPYDTMLDEHEPGTNRAFYNNFFAQVKQCIVPLLSSISMSGRTLSRSCVDGRFDEARQWELATDVANLLGIRQSAHFLTSTEHPFSQAMGPHFALTAGHVDVDDVIGNVYTMLHEIGHNLYEQGVNEALTRTSLAGGTSMGMHEAQSRFFENYVGRDRAFIGPLLDLMRRRFPGQLGRVTPNQLYRAVNRVVPSPIRIDADELTYPLHIVVRYEIEQLLVGGAATAREVPKLWEERYSRYIGAQVRNDTEGALQDVHWAFGSFGYFPTYALGGAYAAQLRHKMIEDGIAWERLLAAGDLAPIREWLREHIWRHGRLKDPAELIEAATGKPLTVRHYADYLHDKFSALYSLR